MNLDLRIPLNSASRALPAAILLDAHREIEFPNAVFNMRHPSAIYAASLRSISEAFNAVLEELTKLDLSRDEGKRLVADTDRLLDAVMEHFNDCESIIKIFFHSDDKACGKILRGWRATVRECRSFVANQVNQIKHSQARLRLIRLESESGAVIQGYFVEGVDESGAVGPHPAVHPGGDGAFSYVRVLRYLLCSVLFASRALPSAIQAKIRIKSDPMAHGLGPLLKLLRSLLKLDPLVFFDEVRDVTPHLEITESRVIVRAGRGVVGGASPPSPGRLEFNLGTDGITRTFKLPYLRPGSTSSRK